MLDQQTYKEGGRRSNRGGVDTSCGLEQCGGSIIQFFFFSLSSFFTGLKEGSSLGWRGLAMRALDAGGYSTTCMRRLESHDG